MNTIIIDTREQQPWSFGLHGFDVVHAKLDEGDYSTLEIKDLEHRMDKKILCIERKRSSGELAGNLGKNWNRFCDEMERMSDYQYKYVILEFSLDTLLAFPEGSGIPKKNWFRKNKKGKTVKNVVMSGNYMNTKLQSLETMYGVEVIFTNGTDEAIQEAVNIINKVNDEYQEEI